MSCLSDVCFFEVFSLLAVSSDLVDDVGFFMASATSRLILVEGVGFRMAAATRLLIDAGNVDCSLTAVT